MIQSTTNYDQFKFSASNRPIDKMNLRKIVNSIKMKNMLELRPICVNKHMEIIDGQHRYEAAKTLGLPIFYTINQQMTDGDMILLNQAQKGWTIADYIHYWAAQGKPAYKQIEDVMHKYNLRASDAICFLSLDSGATKTKIRDGIFDKDLKQDIEDLKEKKFLIDQILQYIGEKTMGNRIYLKSVAIRKALIQLMRSKMFTFDMMMQKLPFGISRIHPCTKSGQYYEMFKSIYNFRNQEPIE